jgi:hypothetical protein
MFHPVFEKFTERLPDQICVRYWVFFQTCVFQSPLPALSDSVLSRGVVFIASTDGRTLFPDTFDEGASRDEAWEMKHFFHAIDIIDRFIGSAEQVRPC